MARPLVPGSGSDVNPQVRVLWLSILKNPAGMWFSGFQSCPPASIRTTRVPGCPRGDLLGRVGGAQARDHLVVAGVIFRGPAVEPIRGGIGQGGEVAVEERPGKGAGSLAVGLAIEVKGQHDFARAGMARFPP